MEPQWILPLCGLLLRHELQADAAISFVAADTLHNTDGANAIDLRYVDVIPESYTNPGTSNGILRFQVIINGATGESGLRLAAKIWGILSNTLPVRDMDNFLDDPAGRIPDDDIAAHNTAHPDAMLPVGVNPYIVPSRMTPAATENTGQAAWVIDAESRFDFEYSTAVNPLAGIVVNSITINLNGAQVQV